MLEYMFSHSVLGLCAWDLPALIVLIVMIVVFGVHCRYSSVIVCKKPSGFIVREAFRIYNPLFLLIFHISFIM